MEGDISSRDVALVSVCCKKVAMPVAVAVASFVIAAVSSAA